MTFYRAPSITMLRRWYAEVPDDFVFTLKANRIITHELRLRDCSAALSDMWSNVAPLGDKLQCVLFQIPPSLYADIDVLKGFLVVLRQTKTSSVKVAFEFRHQSWYVPQVFDMLTADGHAVVLHDMPRRGGLFPHIREGSEDMLIGEGLHRIKLADWLQHAQATFLYIRFHGTVQGQAFQEYGDRYLKPWTKIAAQALENRTPVFAYFGNDPQAAAIRDAKRFRKLLHLPEPLPVEAETPTLFSVSSPYDYE